MSMRSVRLQRLIVTTERLRRSPCHVPVATCLKRVECWHISGILARKGEREMQSLTVAETEEGHEDDTRNMLESQEVCIEIQPCGHPDNGEVRGRDPTAGLADDGE
jgi:hypothetical protein